MREPVAAVGRSELSAETSSFSGVGEGVNWLPFFSCAEAAAFEKRFFGGEAGKRLERLFIRRAAQGIAAETAALFAEIRRRPPRRILVAAGVGNNAADALIAAQLLAARSGRSEISVLLAEPVEKLNANAAAALQLVREVGGKVFPSSHWEQCFQKPEISDEENTAATGAETANAWFGRSLGDADSGEDGGEGDGDADGAAFAGARFEVLLDGLLGHGFRPPVRETFRRLIDFLNGRRDILFRVAVDLPSGLGDAAAEANSVLRADATVGCGFLKTPLLRPENAGFCGRTRLVPIGFPTGQAAAERDAPHFWAANPSMILGGSALSRARYPLADKRHFGHLLVLGGERDMPGALLMNVRAALRAGCGLVTAFCPESVHPAFAAAAPEAMWVPWPESPDGTLALEGEHLLREKLPRATAFLCGSGTGSAGETRALLQSVTARAVGQGIPVILDAGAIQPEILTAARSPRIILLPHAGEYARIAADATPVSGTLAQTAQRLGVAIALKGAPTRIADAGGENEFVVCGGGPFLARGGSGDILAGIVGALFARAHAPKPEFAPMATPRNSMEILAEAVAWHAHAADRAARRHGQDAATALAILDELAFPIE